MKKISKSKLYKKFQKRLKAFQARRPHRSFRRTLRRDYDRSLKLPSYLGFSKYVFNILWKNRKTFLLLALVYAILTAMMVGMASQNTFTSLKETLDSTGGDILKGNFGAIGKAGLLFVATITGSASEEMTEIQQVYSIILILLAWLSSVWLLRNILAGNKVKMRDGLYSSGSPIISTFFVAMLFIVQLLPASLAVIAYSAASSTGLLANGIEAMLFWIAAGLLVVMSLYLITSTFFALIIVTLPGMYPSNAIRAAGDLVVGRRLRILARILWMLIGVAIAWVLITLPAILIDSWLKGLWKAIDWIPTIPVIILALSSLTVIWISAYIYLLYRKVVEDESAPA